MAPICDSSSTDRSDNLVPALHRLVNGEVFYEHLEGFFDAQPLASSIQRLVEGTLRQPMVSKIYLSGDVPFFEASQDERLLRRILEGGLHGESLLTRLFRPYASPLDLVLLALDRAWPRGIQRLEMDGLRYPTGIVRVWPAGYGAQPHQDVLRRETTSLEWARGMKLQLAYNLYLTEFSSGELNVWSCHPSDEEWLREGPAGSYGFKRSKLGDPAVTLLPKAGNLILLNSEYVHAVQPVTAGVRATLSGFIGYLGQDRPLMVWS